MFMYIVSSFPSTPVSQQLPWPRDLRCWGHPVGSDRGEGSAGGQHGGPAVCPGAWLEGWREGRGQRAGFGAVRAAELHAGAAGQEGEQPWTLRPVHRGEEQDQQSRGEERGGVKERRGLYRQPGDVQKRAGRRAREGEVGLYIGRKRED